MKAFAHLAPTVSAVFVTAIGMSLTVYLLHGARVQSEPAPLLAVIGGAAGRVAADLPAAVSKPATEPVGKAASDAQPATTRSVQFEPRRRTAATTARSVPRSGRSGVVRRASSVPRQAAALAAASRPARGHGHGHGHGHARALKSTAGALVPRAHGHGKAFGRSSEHHHGLARGHAKKAPTAPLSAPATPPKMNGGGHGHKGGKK